MSRTAGQARRDVGRWVKRDKEGDRARVIVSSPRRIHRHHHRHPHHPHHPHQPHHHHQHHHKGKRVFSWIYQSNQLYVCRWNNGSEIGKEIASCLSAENSTEFILSFFFWIFPEFILSLPWVYPEFTQSLSWVYPEFALTEFTLENDPDQIFVLFNLINFIFASRWNNGNVIWKEIASCLSGELH